jgi:hypothetical protein
MFWHFGKSAQLTQEGGAIACEEQGSSHVSPCGLALSAAASAQVKTLEPLVINYTIPNAIW